MSESAFEELADVHRRSGAAATLQRLVETLLERREYHRAFDALTMQARCELGLPLLQSSVGAEFSDDVRRDYEDRIIAACRRIGSLLLQQGDVAGAYQYYSLIGELEPIRSAVEKMPIEAASSDDAVLEIALHHGVHPAKGVEMVLARYGVCQAITACEGMLQQSVSPAMRDGCIRVLVGAMRSELIARLRAEIEAKEGTSPAGDSIAELVRGRDWLFEDDNYHIDTSHLNAIVRMARLLPACPEVDWAADLCEYGRRLSEKYRYLEAPPFENVFEDCLAFFEATMGRNVDAALERFRAKAEASDPEEVGTFPREVLVQLLVRTGRFDEAVREAALLGGAIGQRWSCPSLAELCQSAGRYDELSKLARERDDLLHFAAALIQSSPAT